jgi:hypothetical protein
MRSNGLRRGWRAAVLVAAFALLTLTGAAFGQNGVMMQYFHWYNSQSDNLWQKVAAEAANLHNAGFTALWLPPAYKGTSADAAAKASWSPRNHHAALEYDGRLWVIGGWGEVGPKEGNLNDVWSSGG